MRPGNLLQKVLKKNMQKLIDEHNKHAGQEGMNLKKILEKT
jgi:hypothetical protein